MNILFLTHRYPHPPNRGDRIRSFHMLQCMAGVGEVTLGTLYEEPPAEASRELLGSLCREVIALPWHGQRKWWRAGRAILCGKTMTEGLFYDRALRKRLTELAERKHFDAIVIFCSSMFQYLDIFLEAQRRHPDRPRPKVIVDLVDVDSQKWYDYAGVSWGPLRRLFLREGKKLRRLETKIDDAADAILVVTQEEAELYRGFHPTEKVFAVSNGVDTEFFNPAVPELAVVEKIPYRCVFLGAMDYRANIDGVLWFMKEVWPGVRERFPEAEYDVVGSNPADSLRAAAEGVPGVNIVGSVPDVRPYLQRACVAAIPLRVARGIQNKVLEALAMRMAVVASPQAAEGIELDSGQELLICDRPEQWVEQISALFKNESFRYKLGQDGRNLVEERYGWRSRLARLKALLAE